MKWSIKHTCGLLFLMLCAAVFVFLHQFTVPPQTMQYLEWQSTIHILADGTEEIQEFREYSPPPEAPDGTSYRFTTTIPEGFTDGFLMFETSGLEITVLAGETELFSSSMISPEDTVGLGQVHMPLPNSAAGSELTLECRTLGGNALFPPLLRFTTDALAEADTIAYANLTGIPAGIYGFAFILVCGLFLLGAALKKPDRSFLPLSLAAAGLMLHQIAQSCGYYFLPEWFNSIICMDVFSLLILIALAVYLLMNRRRNFWNLFGKATLASAAALLILYLISLARGSYLSSFINEQLTALFKYGEYSTLTYWLILWLVIVCTLISVYALMDSIVQTQSNAKALSIREKLTMDSYRMMEQRLRETAAIRHETNHQLAALDALFRKGDMDNLGKELERLTNAGLNKQSAIYTINIAVNAILQNAAARASDAGVRFVAVALTPEEITIPESDLCGFMMNMLDNALEAACTVKETVDRFIRFRIELNGNFLVFRCENSYSGTIVSDNNGWPQTNKPVPAIHGFGMKHMKEIAEKYGSILDFSYTETTFTVQSALCISEK